MVVRTESEIDKLSSDFYLVGRIHFCTKTLGKGLSSSLLPLPMG